ncbi:MAG: primase-helicase family protein, partial [Syntrophobacteraceae bacterium]
MATNSLELNKEYIEHSYGDVQGYLTLWTAPDKLSYPFASHDTDRLIQEAIKLSETRDVYLHVAVQKDAVDPHHRGTNESAAALPGLFHDLDIKGPGHKEAMLPRNKTEAIQFLDALPLKPTLIVFSGGGLYPHWLFKEPWNFESSAERAECGQLLKRWQTTINVKGYEQGWKLDSTSDLARVLRLPGTLNHKYKPPGQVSILEFNPDVRYNPHDFDQYLIDEPEAAENEPTRTAEDQLQALRKLCGFIDQACEKRGNIAEPLWYAMISNLVSIRPGGPDLCHQYSKGHPKYSRKETEAKIRHAFNDAGPHTCRFIKQNGFDCGKDCKVKAPAALLTRVSGTDAPTNYLEELNSRHAVVMLGGKCTVMNEFIEPVFGRPDISFSSPADFRTRYANQKVFMQNGKGESKAHSIAELWFQNKNRRQYQGVGMFPGKDRDFAGYYNLFRGLAVQPKPGRWSLFDNHIHEIICKGSEQHYTYTINYLAYIFQNTQTGSGKRPEVAVVMKGGRGTGKGSFVLPVGSIFGSHFLHVTSPNQFLGRFNQHLKDCLLLFVDEGFWAGDKTGEGILKGLVTEPTIRVEPKGKDSFEVKNHVTVIIATNNDWAIPAGLDERRFFVLEVSNAHQQDHKYFNALHDEMNNGGREAMLYDLLHMDLSGVNLRNVPQTQGLFEQKLLSADSVTKFWLSKLSQGAQLREDKDWNSFTETQKLYDEYVRYAQNLKHASVECDVVFSKKLRTLCPHGGT